MVSNTVNEIIFTLTRFPVQLFGRLDKDKNDVNGIQQFALGFCESLSPSFFANTRFIVSEDYKTMLSKGALPFSAYYLPSVINGFHSQILGLEADVLITDTLTGCAFIATETEGGQVKVYHFNKQDENGCIDHAGIEAMIKEAIGDEKIIFEIKKPDYDLFPEEHKLLKQDPVFLVGLKGQDNQWSFHYQLSTKSGFTYVNTMKMDEMALIPEVFTKFCR